MRLSPFAPVRAPFLACALLLAACNPRPSTGPAPDGGTGGPAGARAEPDVRLEDVRAELGALAHDSMEGRMTGAPGMERAARYIAGKLREFGVEPAGDDGYFQRLPLALEPGRSGRLRPVAVGAWADTARVPPERRRVGINVVGVLRGSDPALRDQAVVVGAHYDHLGVGRAVEGDSIYNGADDDASGVVTVLEVARALAKGERPKRTVIFLLTTGEEVGMVGTVWYIGHPVVPLENTVADLQVEMVGRPDPLLADSAVAWLTGFERSTMGEMIAASGIPVMADPRPDQQFFLRSDNIAFAYKGIPAHTLSTYGMHTDYHTPNDEPDRIDYVHMTGVVKAAVRTARLLADGPVPVWKPGGRPEPPAR